MRDPIKIGCDLAGWTLHARPLTAMGHRDRPRVGWHVVENRSRRSIMAADFTVAYDGGSRIFDVSREVVLLALVLSLRGLPPVDAGACERCIHRYSVRREVHEFWSARGGSRVSPVTCAQWEADLVLLVGRRTGEKRRIEVRQRHGPTRVEVTGLDDIMATCSCDVDGEPTGRERWDVALAVFESVRHTLLPDPVYGYLEKANRSQLVGERLRDQAKAWEALASDPLTKRDGEVAADLGEERGVRFADRLAFAHVPGVGPVRSPCPDLGRWTMMVLKDRAGTHRHYMERHLLDLGALVYGGGS